MENIYKYRQCELVTEKIIQYGRILYLDLWVDLCDIIISLTLIILCY